MLQVAVWVALSLLIHEVGHAIAVWATGGRVFGIGASLQGFYIRHTDNTPLRNMVVAASGPAANLLSYAVLLAVGSPYAWVALWFGLVNMIPFPHSDLTHAILYWQLAKAGVRQSKAAIVTLRMCDGTPYWGFDAPEGFAPFDFRNDASAKVGCENYNAGNHDYVFTPIADSPLVEDTSNV